MTMVGFADAAAAQPVTQHIMQTAPGLNRHCVLHCCLQGCHLEQVQD
jgi:hypothetical protein